MSEPKFKVGDKARVVGNSSRCRKMNNHVTVVSYGEISCNGELMYKCKKKVNNYWWLLESDLSPIEEQTNLVAEGQSLDGALLATLVSGVGNSVEQMQKIINMLFELSWTVGKKNEAVSWSRFDEAIELRSKQREIELLVNPLYQEWVNKNNKESEFDKLDPKDKEIMRLREIIKKHNIEQNPETSVATKVK